MHPGFFEGLFDPREASRRHGGDRRAALPIGQGVVAMGQAQFGDVDREFPFRAQFEIGAQILAVDFGNLGRSAQSPARRHADHTASFANA